MKLSEKILRDSSVAYLYAFNSDGCKLVLKHSADHPKAGRIEWVTIHDTDIKCASEGAAAWVLTGTNRSGK